MLQGETLTIERNGIDEQELAKMLDFLAKEGEDVEITAVIEIEE